MDSFLYRAESVIEGFRGLPLARVTWLPLRAERLRCGPLEELVAGSENIPSEELSIVRGLLDEFFTLEEGNRLRGALLQAFGYHVDLIGHPLPMTCRDDFGQLLIPLRVLPESTWAGKDVITHRGKLSLPFDVLALWQEQDKTRR